MLDKVKNLFTKGDSQPVYKHSHVPTSDSGVTYGTDSRTPSGLASKNRFKEVRLAYWYDDYPAELPITNNVRMVMPFGGGNGWEFDSSVYYDGFTDKAMSKEDVDDYLNRMYASVSNFRKLKVFGVLELIVVWLGMACIVGSFIYTLVNGVEVTLLTAIFLFALVCVYPFLSHALAVKLRKPVIGSIREQLEAFIRAEMFIQKTSSSIKWILPSCHFEWIELHVPDREGGYQPPTVNPFAAAAAKQSEITSAAPSSTRQIELNSGASTTSTSNNKNDTSLFGSVKSSTSGGGDNSGGIELSDAPAKKSTAKYEINMNLGGSTGGDDMNLMSSAGSAFGKIGGDGNDDDDDEVDEADDSGKFIFS